MDTHITIIGAGVVGLAIAAELSKKFENVFVIEKHTRFGQETSSRNSEIIHSGVYYPKNSLKARLCIEGKALLYKYCTDKDINFNQCGKLIIARNNDEEKKLKQIHNQAGINGVTDHKIIERKEVLSLEPNIHATKAIYFPATGIIDSFSLMKSLETEAVTAGVEFVYGSEVVGLKKTDIGYRICVSDQQYDQFEFTSKLVINCAGLHSGYISRLVGLKNKNYEIHYWKGEYFTLINGKHKFISRLIYPLPETNVVGLGVHTTIDLSGRVKLGPNAIYLKDGIIDYSIQEKHARDFYDSARTYLPFLDLVDLSPDQVGIRPKLQRPGDPIQDFIIKEETDSGYPGFINLLGIESPGLTSCLSIAKFVSRLIQNKQ